LGGTVRGLAEARVLPVNRSETAEVIERFASHVLEARDDPDANARATVIAFMPPGWPTEEYEGPSELPYNAVAIIEVQPNAGSEGAVAAAILRDAMAADPGLGGRIDSKVRVLPLDKDDPGQVRALIHIDDP
jgi:hypothetical protein